VFISATLALVGWMIVQAGLLPWATAQSAILVHIAVPLLVLRGGFRPAPESSIR
jgi:hypothetical protein